MEEEEVELILNLDTSSFFRCKPGEDRRNKILRSLLTPPKGDTVSHWKRSDKIILVPKHLYDYVDKQYGELFIE